MTGQTVAEHVTAEHEVTENIGFRKIERRLKNPSRYSGRVRERNACPICNSLDVAKRVNTQDYKCRNCKWIGKDVDKIMT